MWELYDVGVNLNDDMFKGVYNSVNCHQNDLEEVIQKSQDYGIKSMINLSGNLEESINNIELLNRYTNVYTTVGVHPTRCMEIELSSNSDKYFADLIEIIHNNPDKVVAIGECGLDYDRCSFCSKEIQMKWFKRLLEKTQHIKLPYLFHMRNSCDDFLSILAEFQNIQHGLVHCFTGTVENVQPLLNRGMFIGITGCSLRNKETVEAIQSIPLDRILIETDSPWCKLRPSFEGYKYITSKFAEVKPEKWGKSNKVFIKGRQEPSLVLQIYEAVSSIKKTTMEELVNNVKINVKNLFKI